MSRAALPQVPAAVLGRRRDAAVVAALRKQATQVLLVPGRDVLPGLLTALEWAAALGAQAVATAPADAPFIPGDLLLRLTPLIQYGRAIVVSDGERVHPAIGLWPINLIPRLRADLAPGARCPQAWSREVGRIEVLYLHAARSFFRASRGAVVAA